MKFLVAIFRRKLAGRISTKHFAKISLHFLPVSCKTSPELCSGGLRAQGINRTRSCQKNPRVRKMFCPQFWGRKWLSQFHGRLAKLRSFCRKTSMPIKFLVLGGGDFVFLGGGGMCRFYCGRDDFCDRNTSTQGLASQGKPEAISTAIPWAAGPAWASCPEPCQCSCESHLTLGVVTLPIQLKHQNFGG